MRSRGEREDEGVRDAAARNLPVTPGLEGLAAVLGQKPEKAPVAPLHSEQPLPSKTVARGRRPAAPKAKTKKRGRRAG